MSRKVDGLCHLKNMTALTYRRNLSVENGNSEEDVIRRIYLNTGFST